MAINAGHIEKRKFTIRVNIDQHIDITIRPVITARTRPEELHMKNAFALQYWLERGQFFQKICTANVSHAARIAAAHDISN